MDQPFPRLHPQSFLKLIYSGIRYTTIVPLSEQRFLLVSGDVLVMRANLRSVLTGSVVNMSVAIAGLILVSMTAMLAWQAYTSHVNARHLQQVNRITDELLHAAAYQARERGLTSAALSEEVPTEVLARLENARTSGDQHWHRALALTSDIPRNAATSAIEVHRARAEKAWEALESARTLADQSIQASNLQIELHHWFDTATEVIESGASLGNQVLLSTDSPAQVTQLNLSVHRSLWLISEMMGQIRGTLSFQAGAGMALTPKERHIIEHNRAEIDRKLKELLLLREMPAVNTRLLESLAMLEETLHTRFDPDLQAMLTEGETGRYPMDAIDWYDAATIAIDNVLETSNVVSEITETQVNNLARQNGLAFAGFSFFALLSGALAAGSMAKVRRNANALFLQKELAETTLDSIGDAVITTDHQARIEYLNPVAEELTGWTTAEAKGRPCHEVLQIEDTQNTSPADPVSTCLKEGHVIGLTNGHVLLSRDGQRIGIEQSAAPIRDRAANVVGCVVVFYSTELPRQTEHLLSYHATRDALTGLINRREFTRRLDSLIAEARVDGEQHVLAYLDLDQFKVLNDTCGHAAGDRMLRQITFLLRKHIRDSDTLARLGGDEFALLLRNCSTGQAMRILDTLRHTLRRFRFTWAGRSFEISVSIGAVAITSASASQSELLSQADAACFAAKAKGRNRVQFYHPNDVELSRQQSEMCWVTEITDALRVGRLELHCQPLLPLKSDLPECVEVLVRLRLRDGTLVPPMAFIPAAERYNLMADVDRWVIRNACKILAGSRAGNENTLLNINLSGLSLSDNDLSRFIHQQTREFRIAPKRLCFEITETTAAGNIDTVLDLMHPLIEQGFSFALDDFGTGLSSLTYLKNLPVKQIKIDGSFVRNMTGDPVDRVMVESVVHIAQVLDVAVTAESVEEQEALDALRDMGVDYAQGYLIGRPIPLEAYLAGEREVTNYGYPLEDRGYQL